MEADPLLIRFCDRWRELVSSQGPTMIAISGGADSCALLDLCCCAGYPVVAWHLDHGLRADSAEDAAFVMARVALYRERGHHVDLITERATITAESQRRRGVEDAARRERYRRLRVAATKLGFSTVAVAHHRSDQAETVLLNLLRGSDVVGRAGIPARRALAQGVDLVRPLLDCDPQVLRNWLQQRNLDWREDPSNRDQKFARNRIRHSVLPTLEHGVPDLQSALSDLARQAQIEVNELDAELDPWWPDISQVSRLDLAPLLEAAQPVRAHAWRRLLQQLPATLTRPAIERVEDLVFGAVGRELTLGHWVLRRSTDALSWQSATGASDPGEHMLDMPGAATVRGWHVDIQMGDRDQLPLPDRNEALIDADSINGCVAWRGARRGERWQALGAPGSRSVVTWLGEHGVPSRQREHHPVLADEEGVIWVPGHTIADRVRIDDSTTAMWHVTALQTPADTDLQLS